MPGERVQHAEDYECAEQERVHRAYWEEGFSSVRTACLLAVPTWFRTLRGQVSAQALNSGNSKNRKALAAGAFIVITPL